MAGRTTLVISHRLSSVHYADKIVFIEDGKISEMGKHIELLEKKGRYWRMWSQQKSPVY
jgi:ABC-type multidrug transport system fused ATPase/permease subunit